MSRAQRIAAIATAFVLLAVAPMLAAGPTTSARLPGGIHPVTSGGQGGCTSFVCTGTTENEPNCGLTGGVGDDTVDGGCNSDPAVFWPIALGETICGSAALDAQSGFRDTDWYEVNLTNSLTEVTFTVEAEFPALVGVINGNGGCPVTNFTSSLVTTGCGDSETLTVQLGSGTWWFFVAPDFDTSPAVTCGDTANGRYSATLNGTEIQVLQEIPTLSYVGFALLAALLAGVGFWFLKQRRARPTA